MLVLLALTTVGAGVARDHRPVAAAVAADSTPSLPVSRLVPLDPVRLLDTREGRPAGAGFIGAGQSLRLVVAGVSGIGVDATAVVVNLTATESAGAGFVTAWPAGSPRPEVSNLNLTAAGQTRPNLAIIPVGTGGAIELFSSVGTHLVADVAGWFAPAGNQPGGRFTAVDPTRLLDTRIGLLPPPPVPAGTTFDVAVTGLSGIPPTGVSAVAVNVTAVDAIRPGFVTVWPSGTTRPLASTLNTSGPGETVPNAAIVRVGANGRISLFTQHASHFVIDVTGWFGTEGTGEAGLFVPLSPIRIGDTRRELGIRGLPAGRRVDLAVGAQGSLPAGRVGAVAVNLTATEAYGDGFVTHHPGATTRPTASTLNPSRGDTRAGLAVARLGHGDGLSLFSSAGTELVVDLFGYFVGTPRPPEPGVALVPPAPDLGSLPARLDAVLADPDLRGMLVSATVWVDGVGEIYARSPDAELIPASNQKLLTAAGALTLLAPTHTLNTRFLIDPTGNAYLRAGGDPTLRRGHIDEMARQLAAAGITSVADLVIDTTRHERRSSLPGWEHLERNQYGPLSALMIDDNRYRTDAAFHADPDPFNGTVVRAALAAAGVTVTGSVRVGPTPPAATLSVDRPSPTVAELVDTMLESSDNEIAEALLREIDAANGGAGSSAGGAARAAAAIATLGVDAGDNADGSGLSYQDRHSSRQLVQLLVALRAGAIGDEIAAGLPIAARTGTLASRLRTPTTYGNVRAKTGTLDVSRALSGYLELSDGTDVVFSIMVNATTTSAARPVIDEWVETIASS